MRARVQNIISKVISREDGDCLLILYCTINHMDINSINQDYITVTKREVVEILEAFTIMNSWELVRLDRNDDREKIIDEYLHKFGFI